MNRRLFCAVVHGDGSRAPARGRTVRVSGCAHSASRAWRSRLGLFGLLGAGHRGCLFTSEARRRGTIAQAVGQRLRIPLYTPKEGGARGIVHLSRFDWDATGGRGLFPVGVLRRRSEN